MKLFSIFAIFLVILSTFEAKLHAQTIGTVLHTESTSEGYTLFSPFNEETYLVDNCGRTINSWSSEYLPGMWSQLDENGNLYRTGKLPSSTFDSGGNGGLLEKYNWNGELVWQFEYANDEHHQHHDFEVLPNGNILIIAVEKISLDQALSLGRDPETIQNDILWIETIVEIKPLGPTEGEIVWKWSFIDHLVQEFDSALPNYGNIKENLGKLNFNYSEWSTDFDWVHLNGIDYNPELDQIIISSRHTEEIYIIDHSTNTEEAASSEGGNSNKGGDFLYRWGNPAAYNLGEPSDKMLFGPHDPQWISDHPNYEGMISIFNNGFNRIGGIDYSSIDIISPPIDSQGVYIETPGDNYGPLDLAWTFEANPPESFLANSVSGSHQLKNGNFIITHGPLGTIYEYTSEGEKTWEYRNPVTLSGPNPQGSFYPIPGGNLFNATKYESDFPGFLDKDLTPQSVIELGSTQLSCLTNTYDKENKYHHSQSKLYPNPTDGYIHLSITPNEAYTLQIVDLLGNQIINKSFTPNISVHDLPKGCYYLLLEDTSNKIIYNERFIKL